MKILIGQMVHETNTFASSFTDEAHFRELRWLYDDELLSLEGSRDYISAVIAKAKELDVELIPTFSAFNVGGIIKNETYDTMCHELLSRIEANLGNFDGIYLSLHGAACTEDIADVEADFLRRVRAIVGSEMPITASFDLHGNISAEMVSLLNGVVVTKEYPHTDLWEAGTRAFEILVRTLRGTAEPKLAYRRIPILLPCSTGLTTAGPGKAVKDKMAQYCEEHGLLDVSFFQGFPYADIPDAACSVVVTADGDQALADKAVEELAAYVWEHRSDFDPEDPLPEEAVDRALAMEGGPIVINEASDNPGGGAPGDGTYLLAELLRRDLPQTCYGHIYDPEFVDLAVKAGVGATITGKLGGKCDNLHGGPLDVTAYVKCITDGVYISDSAVFAKGLPISMGLSVRVQIGNVDVIVVSVQFQTLDDRVFSLHGIDVSRYKIVALKSAMHFRACFAPICAGIITTDPPGISTCYVSQLPYKNLCRPIYPLDSITEMP